jgi:hypothetical protein
MARPAKLHVAAGKTVPRVGKNGFEMIRTSEWSDAGKLEGFAVSASIGVAERRDGRTLAEVLERADRRCTKRRMLE